ncbi:MAG: alpha/beta family hydrolase [Candidatus Cloacimonadaceae bacterium]|nr:alpha/beta family hydrolase [Candidatus Cloacimonadaceae bacterium]
MMKIRTMLFLIIVCTLFSICPHLRAEGQSVALDMDITIPESAELFPCLIICPGRGYHKDLPLIRDLASRAGEEGFAVVRFNWSFFSAKTQPSADGAMELADIDAALQQAKMIPGVDTTRIYIAGKSMGSVFGYHAFHKNPELFGCLLLTPLIPESGMGKAYYPGLDAEERKVVFILGDKDVHNCSLPNLYEYLAETGKSIPVVVLAGAHSFEDTAPGSDAQNQANTKMAVETSVYWLRQMAGWR